MHMNVDESRRNDVAPCIDRPARLRVNASGDYGNLIAADADLCAIPRTASSVDHAGISYDQVIRRRLCPERSESNSDADGQPDSTARAPHHVCSKPEGGILLSTVSYSPARVVGITCTIVWRTCSRRADHSLARLAQQSEMTVGVLEVETD